MFGDLVIYRVHALRRMFERAISEPDIRRVLNSGEEIETYSLDQPYPSRLLLGFVKTMPIHVVAAYNATDDQTIIVTVYRPDPLRWTADFRTRR
jgi:hypothetical protein